VPTGLPWREIAGTGAMLIAAIAAIGFVVWLFCISYKPPSWIKGVTLFFRGVGIKLDRQEEPTIPVEKREEEPVKAESTEAISIGVPEPREAETVKPSLFEQARKLFKEGQFRAGYDIYKEDIEKDTPSQDHAALFSFGAFHALELGCHEALEELKNLAENNPSIHRTHIWLGMGLSYVSEFEQALNAYSEALERASSIEEKIGTILNISSVKLKLDNHLEAIETLRNGFSDELPPKQKSRLLKALGDLYWNPPISQKRLAFALYEAAIKYDRTNETLRFSLAYDKYDKVKEEERIMVFYHYNELIKINPQHGTALNNLGVAAQEFELPFTAVDYYRKSEEREETLAMANLARIFITGGFKTEALEILTKAQQSDSVHRNVRSVLGNVTDEEYAEEGKINIINNSAQKLHKLRLNEYEALLGTQVQSADLEGEYDGEPTDLKLNSKPDGSLVGEFPISPNLILPIKFQLTGHIDGSLFHFTWESLSTKETPTILGGAMKSSGYGSLCISNDGNSLTGYRISTQDPNDPIIIEWNLQRKTNASKTADS
jgi:tetratricopeptide (TPR) repeat protein